MPSDIQLYRYELVEPALSGEVVLSKVDAMRPFLEKCGHRLTSSAQHSELIPAVLDKEKETLKEELKVAKEASVIFDGTARLGEALAIVVHYIHTSLRSRRIKGGGGGVEGGGKSAKKDGVGEGEWNAFPSLFLLPPPSSPLYACYAGYIHILTLFGVLYIVDRQ